MGEAMNSAKQCTRCGIERPFSEFSPHKGGKNGLRSICKKCKNKQKQLRQMPTPPIYKACKTCAQVIPSAEFYPHLSTIDGLNPSCKMCCRDANAAYRKKNKEALLLNNRKRYHAGKTQAAVRRRDWYEKNRLGLLKKKAMYYIKNKDLIIAKSALYYAENTDKVRERAKRFRQNHRPHLSAVSKLRKATKHNATPQWSDSRSIANIYALAACVSRRIGSPHHVDHVVPLNGPMLQSLNGNSIPQRIFIGPLMPAVQGLHCTANLQILSSHANISKGNRWWPDMPEYIGFEHQPRRTDYIGIQMLKMPHGWKP